MLILTILSDGTDNLLAVKLCPVDTEGCIAVVQGQIELDTSIKLHLAGCPGVVACSIHICEGIGLVFLCSTQEILSGWQSHRIGDDIS